MPDETAAAAAADAAADATADAGTEAAADPWTEVLAAWAAAIACVWAAWRFLPEAAAPFATAGAWVAAGVVPHLVRGRPLAAQGIAWRSIRRSARLVALYAVVFLPLYAAGYMGVAGVRGWEMPAADVLIFAFVGNLFFAALPEEMFFRGFVQPRLGGAGAVAGGGGGRSEGSAGGGARGEAAGGRAKTVRVLFVPLSRPIVAAAAIFAVTHVVFLANPASLAGLERLTTFFPGLLFGALREESGDVMTPALFHALCNAWLYSIQHGYHA